MKEFSEVSQERHFNGIAKTYRKHYGDKWSSIYRDRFINNTLFKNINVHGKNVIDAMCGNGETIPYLLARGANITALDISKQELCHVQERWPQCNVHRASILDTGLQSNNYDYIVIVGGLHHVHPYCFDAITETHRLLKSGGYFCFMEPHQGSIFNVFRNLWYRYDKYFAENEKGVDITKLKNKFQSEFTFINEEYKGNIGYLFILNSMIWRMPEYLKRIYSPFFLFLEYWIEKIQNKKTSCYVVCQWRKK